MTLTRQLMHVAHHLYMDEKTLRWFLSLCQTENMRDSAASEHVPQPTLSRALARLEREIGVPLFDRRGRRLHLNRFGVLVREHALRVIEELDAARRRVREQTDPDRGIVRLGFLQSVARWMVPRVVARYRRTVPDAHVELRQGFARDLFGWLHDDLIDAALVTPPPRTEQHLEWAQLDVQRLSLALPPGHPLTVKTEVSIADTDGQPFVAFSTTTDLRHVVDEMLARSGVRPVLAFESSEIDTMRGLISAGLGVGILPEPARRDDDDPVYRPLTPRVLRRLGVAWETTTTKTAAVDAFLGQVRPVAEG